jgi:FAD/FMN-containing dehydrogenase
MIERALARFAPLQDPEHLELAEGGARAPDGTEVPLLSLRPRSVEAAQACVRVAAEDAIPLAVIGGGSSPPCAGSEGAVALELGLLSGILDHAAADLVLSVRAGTQLQEVSRHLVRRGHKLPFGPLAPMAHTIGGLLARGEDGFFAPAYGRMRDQVLGLEILHGDGRITRCGGRVVKNVTGYDLARLHVGARGCFGILLAAHLRLRAEERAACTLVFHHAAAASAIAHGLELRRGHPEIFALHGVARAPEGGRTELHLHLRGEEEFVERAAETLFAEPGPDLDREVAGPVPAPILDRGAEPGRARLRLAILPSESRRLADREDWLGPARSAVWDLLQGVLVLGYDPQDREPLLQHLLSSELEESVPIELPDEPGGEARILELFPGQRLAGPASTLARRLKAAFDPRGILPPVPGL